MKNDENNPKKLILTVFLLINLLSPWFWVLAKNPADFKITANKFYQTINENRLYEINTLRGEATGAGLGLLGKLTVNKYSWLFKEILARAEESLDPYFLFFKGDLNIKRSVWVFGPVFWIILPSVCFGFSKLSQKQERVALALMLLFAFLGAPFEEHYFTPAKIPFFLIFNWLAAVGLVNFLALKKFWLLKLSYLFLILFELMRFIHDFYFHYPTRLLT